MSGLSVVTATFPGNLSCFPRSTFSPQSCAVFEQAAGSCCWLLTSSDESDGFLGWADTLAVVDSAADGVGNDLEDLVMTPTVAPIPQGFRAEAENMLQGPSPLAQRACW